MKFGLRSIKTILCGPTLICLVLAFLGPHWGGVAFSEPLCEVCGLYWSPNHDAKIEIAQSGDGVSGRFAWLKNSDKDELNPNPKLKDRELVGVEFITGFSANGERRWTGGLIYDPESGSTYHAEMWFEKGDLSHLKLRGYVGLPLFGRTETFERVRAEKITK